MAMSTVTQPEEGERKPSALENAAKIMGIAVNLGSLGFKAADVLKGTPTAEVPKGPDLSMPVAQPKLEVPGLPPVAAKPKYSLGVPDYFGGD